MGVSSGLEKENDALGISFMLGGVGQLGGSVSIVREHRSQGRGSDTVGHLGKKIAAGAWLRVVMAVVHGLIDSLRCLMVGLLVLKQPKMDWDMRLLEDKQPYLLNIRYQSFGSKHLYPFVNDSSRLRIRLMIAV